MSPSVDYNILIKSSTGPSAVNSKAIVDNKVFPYLLLSIYTNIKAKIITFFKAATASSSVNAAVAAMRHTNANIVNYLI